ncbi:MAG: PIN domain-containing protein [Chloroflexi bacterium]|nr:PIN domain-containing protein [Chloroflexota bacterium]
MRTVFADAGYWIGMLFGRDQLHELAVEVTARLAPLDIITTQMIVVEVFNHASRFATTDRQVVVEWLRDLERSERIEIVPQTPHQFRAAAERFAARADQS